MDTSNTILTLSPADHFGLAFEACQIEHNSSRYLAPSAYHGPSRETTPCDPEVGTSSVGLEQFHRIRLGFNDTTKHPGRITLGSDPARCDVVLTRKRGWHDISGQHLHITFDVQQRLIVQDVSTYGTSVSYNGQAKRERRRGFQWILFNKRFDEIIITLWRKDQERTSAMVEGLALKVHFSIGYQESQQDFTDQVEHFMAQVAGTMPYIEDLAFDSRSSSIALSQAASPTKRPIFIEGQELGRGSFGQVYKLINVSTGLEYAGKKFFRTDGWEREIDIMRNLFHERLVKFECFIDETRILVMEYLPLGNLEMQYQTAPISEDDMILVLFQLLDGVRYLHSCRITHRDIKPENILVSGRSPISVKLADFGLSKNRSRHETVCGTHIYAAPEIHQHRPYTNAVDIWSLGVVILEIMYGLPGSEPTTWDPTFCRRIINRVVDWESDLMIDFLKDHMLQWRSKDRLSAAGCLTEGLRIGLFVDSANADTPRPRSTEGIDMSKVTYEPDEITDAVKHPSVEIESPGVFLTIPQTWSAGDWTVSPSTLRGNELQESGRRQLIPPVQSSGTQIWQPLVISSDSDSDVIQTGPQVEAAIKNVNTEPIPNSSTRASTETSHSRSTASQSRSITYPSELLDLGPSFGE